MERKYYQEKLIYLVIYINKSVSKLKLEPLINKFMKVLILMLFSCLYAYSSPQQGITTQVSNILCFKQGEWKMEGKKGFFMMTDSTQTYRNKHPMVCSQCCIGGVYFMLQGAIQNSLPLPVIEEDSIEVSLTCKSQELEYGFLAINSINKKEELLYKDTLFFNNCAEWTTLKKDIPACGTSLLGFSIGFKGNDTIFTAKKNESYNSTQNLWLDRIEIKINGKNITNHVIPLFDHPLHKKDVVEWDNSLQYPFKDKDIVAFGETVHGSENINRTIIQLFKNEIKYGRRKLILLELPLSKMLYINRFVQGDSTFQINKVSSIIEPSLYSNAWIDFFCWLKEYNSKTKEKVWALGTDYNISKYLETELDLCEYIQTINKSQQKPHLKKLARLILNSKDSIQEAITFFQLQSYFENELGKQEAQLVQTCLQLIKQTKQKQFSRDKLMFKQVQIMMDLFSSSHPIRAILYSHLAHVKYTSNHAEQSATLGSLCKQYYGDRFFTVGIFTGKGKTLNFHYPKEMQYCSLNKPIFGSIEYWLNQVPLDNFYVSQSFLPTKLLSSRSIGAFSYEITEWINPSCQMDGMLFIKESVPLQKKTFNTNSNVFIHRYKECWDELKNK